jgi:hypothetical protein
VTERIPLAHGCAHTIDHERRTVTTHFPCGLCLTAAPVLNQESVVRARELGYTGTDQDAVWAMTQDHDLTHMLLAQAEGMKWSPTLYGVAAGVPYQPAEAAREEARVLFVQRAAHTGLRSCVPALEQPVPAT